MPLPRVARISAEDLRTLDQHFNFLLHDYLVRKRTAVTSFPRDTSKTPVLFSQANTQNETTIGNEDFFIRIRPIDVSSGDHPQGPSSSINQENRVVLV